MYPILCELLSCCFKRPSRSWSFWDIPRLTVPAFSYDGDDNVTKTSPQRPDPVAAEPPPATSPTQIIEPPKDTEETTVDAPYGTSNQYQLPNGNEQTGNNPSGWGNGLTNNHNEQHVEPDSYGTGIKEDG